MQTVSIKDAMDNVKTHGRTFFDETEGVLYANYTCGAIEMEFEGTLLAVTFTAIPDTMVPPARETFPGQKPPKREDWPYVAVVLDDAETPCKKVQVKSGDTVVAFLSATAERHRVKFVKLTENVRTALGVVSITMEGALVPFCAAQKERIEFIGDSITCGFGNATNDVSHEFEAREEDGWMTHGAIAARTLGLEPRFISVSGISIDKTPGMPGPYSMRELYPFADRVIEDKLAEKRDEAPPDYRPFDFAAYPAKYIVLNLGTNDASQIYFSRDKRKAEQDFVQNYTEFVKEVRRLNGPDATIICALGCMDYYLFDTIKTIVEQLREQTGDKKLTLLKYNKMMNVGPDAGACLHPAIYRHKLMAEDLVQFIRTLEQ